MAFPLKHICPDNERDLPRFSVFDIESAAGWINFLVIGLGWKVYDDDGIEKEKRYEYFENMGEFCSFIFEDAQPNNRFFAHFGGKYDDSFLLKEFYHSPDKYYIHKIIPRGSGLLCFSVSTFTRELVKPDDTPEDDVIGRTKEGHWLIIKRTITFWDSSAILPFSLASLTENFGVEHKKQEIDYEAIKEVTPELLEYLEYDIWGLYECLEKHFKWPLIRGAGFAMTIASQSLKVFRTFLKDEIKPLRQDVDGFVRCSYFGGRTEIFKPFYEQHTDTNMLRSYDVNSLYPFIMRTLDYPGGFKFETQVYLENQLGFYDCEVEVPDMYVPPLGLRFEGMENRLIFPIGKFRGNWSTMELNYAQSVGVKITKIHRGMIFHNIGPIFKDYIDYLYSIRKKSKKGSVDDILCKLIMNSTYGRFALNLHREQLEFDNGQIGFSPHMEIPLDDSGKRIIRLGTTQTYLEDMFTNVAIGAWVTSGARIHMHKLILSATDDDMYYMDTDSLKTTHIYPRNDAELGKLKLEYKMKMACFLLPKTYIEETTSPMFKLYDAFGKERKDAKTSKKLVMKGFDKKKISKFTPDDFKSCLEGDMKRLQAINPKKFATLKTAIRKNEFLLLLNETPRQIRTRYNKRKTVKRAWSQVYDTEPLHVKDGAITNLDKNILKKWKAPTVESMAELERGITL